MSGNSEKSSIYPSNKPPDWVMVGISIVTIATVVASATAALAVGIVWERTSEDSSLIGLAVIPAVASLIAYCGVVVTGLSPLFRSSLADREEEAKNSAKVLFLQICVVLVFVLLAIVGPLFASTGQGNQANGEQPQCPAYNRPAAEDTH